MIENEIKDRDIKNLFTNLKIEEPSAAFESKIIAKSLAKRPTFNTRYAAIAAMFLFVMSFSIMNLTTAENAAEYANLLDDSAIINEDDIYADIIIASNES